MSLKRFLSTTARRWLLSSRNKKRSRSASPPLAPHERAHYTMPFLPLYTLLSLLFAVLCHRPTAVYFFFLRQRRAFVTLIFQLVALGPRGYAKDKFNLFDGLVVLSSVVELAVWPPNILTGGEGEELGGGLSALRSFRVFRILKLAR